MTVGHIIDGEIIIGNGHHQAACTLNQKYITLAFKCFRTAVNYVEINVAMVEPCCKLRRTGMGEYQRSRSVVEVLGKIACAHNATVHLYVLRHIIVASLNKFLGQYLFALIHQPAGKPTCAIRFSGIGVYAGYKIFHC